MKVLHVIPAIAPRYGGPSAGIVDMCRALETIGVSTLIATTDADGDARLDVPLGVPCSWNGVHVVFFPREWSEAFKYSRPLAQWLHEHVSEYSAVHVHGVLSHASLAAGRAARTHGVPCIYRPLGTLDDWSLSQKGWRKHLLLKLSAGRLLGQAAAVQYTSGEERRQVEQRFGLSNGTILPLGVDESWFEGESTPNEPRARNRYVLTLSRLHPVKNLEAFIEAFADAADKGVDSNGLGSGDPAGGWKLIVGGSGHEAYSNHLRSVADRRNAAAGRPIVELCGWVERSERERLVRHASLFALPSLHESFGVALMEAAAAGVPALVASGVHLREAIREAGAGWVAEPDRASLSAALREALANSEELCRRGAAARRMAKAYSWSSIARRLVSLYGSLTAGRASTTPTADRARLSAQRS